MCCGRSEMWLVTYPLAEGETVARTEEFQTEDAAREAAALVPGATYALKP